MQDFATATTNQTSILHRRSKQQLRKDTIIDAMMMPYVMSQEARMTAMMVDCDKRSRLRN
jgi:hypothetical protein